MSGDPPIIETASTAAAAGGAGRILLALHGGERHWLVLLFEAGLGALHGIIAASTVTYLAPSLRDAGLLIVGSAAGPSSALETGLLDMVVAGLERRMGS